jgi:hypothetical protein
MATRSIPTTSWFRRSGGDPVLVTKETIFERLSLNFPEWKNRTVIFPVLPDLRYDGPVGFPGVPEQVELNHQNDIRGQNNEVKVLKIYQKHSLSQNLNWKIFHGVHVSPPKMRALCDAFQSDLEISPEQLEIDIVAVDRSSIYLMEVKSSFNKSFKAIEQLGVAENFIKRLFKIVGLKEATIPITKVFAVPGKPSTELLEEAEKGRVIIFDFNKDSDSLSRVLRTQDEAQKTFESDDLIAALAFLRSCPTFYSEETHLQNLRKSLLVGVKGSEIAGHLEQHKHLKKLNHPGVEKKQLFQNMFLWLDPYQAKILSDKNPYQVIIGPASTGKTIMVQLKVLEILRKSKDDHVLIILPSNTLRKKYEEFFVKAIDGQTKPNIKIVTAREGFFSELSTSPHIFIDKFCASATISDYFLNQFRKLTDQMEEKIAAGRFVWITVDVKQSLENFWVDSTPVKVILELQSFSKSTLGMIHRCTNKVLDSYLDFCGPLLSDSHPCHQYEGNPLEVIRLESQNSSDEVKKIIEEQMKEGWDFKGMTVVIVPNHPCMVSFYLQLKEKCPEVKIHFESETLSNEWPLVIACSSASEENENPLTYVAFSRAIFQLISIAIKPSSTEQSAKAGKIKQREQIVTKFTNYCKRILIVL